LAERRQRDGQHDEATDKGSTEISFDASYERHWFPPEVGASD
jgi:hypothetical protein